MIIVIDNYDSFTYNLVHYLGELGASMAIYRNDSISVADLLAQHPAGLLLSPGPATPDKAGICLELVQAAAHHKIPLLGVCLGHQSIGQCFGGRIGRADVPMHGKTSAIEHYGHGVFSGLPSPFQATRYHSLIVEPDSLPECLSITATAEDSCIMGVRHKDLPIEGVQFHPESIKSQYGHALLKTFLDQVYPQ